MLTVDELRQKAEAYAYQRDGMSLKAFEEWFEDNSIDAEDDAELEELRMAIEAAFGAYHFDRIGEAAFRKELIAAVRPFASSNEAIQPHVFSEALNVTLPFSVKGISKEYSDSAIPFAGWVQVGRWAYQK